VPDRCTVSFDRRIIPEETLEDVEAEMVSFFDNLQRQDESLSLELTVTFKAPPIVVPTDAYICRVVSDTITQLAGASPTCTVSCGGFETVLFVNRGVQAVTYGPGVEGCAHAAGEHTIVADLATTAQVYALTALRLLAEVATQLLRIGSSHPHDPRVGHLAVTCLGATGRIESIDR
jgi:succinyl-diaminopimelate desuccinylase